MRNLYYLVGVVYSIFFFLSCSTESTPIYELSTFVVPSEAGSISPSHGEYEEGTRINMTATPNEGWYFVRWEADYGGVESEISFRMNHDKFIRAVFDVIEYALEINTTGAGEVQTEVVQSKHTDYEYGTTLRLTAEPDYGWEFDRWEGTITGTQNPIEFQIEAPHDVTAVFKLKTYEISLDVDQGGEVFFAPSRSIYQHGEEVEVRAIPRNGYRFDGWEGNITLRNNPAQFVIENNISLSARFSELTFLEIGEPYIATDGMEVTVNSFETIEKIGSYQYTINYTLHNPTNNEIKENPFNVYNKNNQNNLPQYGAFGTLFPGDTHNRSHTYEALKSEEFHYIGYVAFYWTSSAIRQNEVTLTWEVKY